MTKAKLLRLLENVPDDAVILCPGSDHSYNTAGVSVTTALYSPGDRSFSEDHGDDHMEPGDTRVKAVVIE